MGTDTFRSRFRDQASEILQENATLSVAMGHGPTFSIETCYFVGDSDELYCIVKPTPALIEAVRDDACVAFTVTGGFPHRMLQGTGRAFFLEGLDQHPQVREQVLAKVPDATMFVTTIRNLGVVKILPDQIDITDDTNLGLGPRTAYAPAGALALPGRRLRWLYALRVSSWPASLVPILIGALLALDVPAGAHGWLVIPLAVAVLLIQVGTILVNTADDRIRGRKRPEDLGASRVLLDGLLPVHPVFRVGMLCIGIGAIIGLFLAELRGLPLLLMGLVGTLSGFLYAGWPIRPRWSGMDEGIVFVCMGPLLVLSSFFVLTGVYRHSALLISLPIGLLAEAMFHGNQLKAFADGAQAKTPALAMALGWMGSRLMYGALIVLPYILVLLLVLLVIVPEWTLLVFVSGPLAAWAALSVRGTPPRETQALASLERPAMWLHLAFGLLLALGLVLGSGGELTRALSDLGAELIP